MATQDFGLSFTVSAPALWVDNQQGKLGEASTIFADVTTPTKLGETSNIFADIVVLDKLGESSTIAGRGLICRRNLIGAPLRSILSGPFRNLLFSTCSPFTTALEGYYIFDGNGFDYSGNGRDLTFGGTEQYTTGILGPSFIGAYNPNGTNGNFAIDANDSVFNFLGLNAEFAISVWVRLNSSPATGRPVVEKRGSPGGTLGWTLVYTGSNQYTWRGTGSTVVIQSGVTDTNWHHLVITSDGFNVRTYFDGVAGNSIPFVEINSTVNPLRIANHFDFSDTLPFDGRIDEAAFWTRNLTATEVAFIYNNGAGLSFT